VNNLHSAVVQTAVASHGVITSHARSAGLLMDSDRGFVARWFITMNQATWAFHLEAFVLCIL
jgi:hypothetical protein